MDELSGIHWAILLFGSLIMGLSKGGIPGAGNLTVAMYALVLEDALGPTGVAISVGLLLPVLISADLVSTMVYRKYIEWKHLRRLLPFFAIGVIAGWSAFDFFSVCPKGKFAQSVNWCNSFGRNWLTNFITGSNCSCHL